MRGGAKRSRRRFPCTAAAMRRCRQTTAAPRRRFCKPLRCQGECPANHRGATTMVPLTAAAQQQRIRGPPRRQCNGSTNRSAPSSSWATARYSENLRASHCTILKTIGARRAQFRRHSGATARNSDNLRSLSHTSLKAIGARRAQVWRYSGATAYKSEDAL